MPRKRMSVTAEEMVRPEQDALVDAMNRWKHRAIVATGLILAVILCARLVEAELTELIGELNLHSTMSPARSLRQERPATGGTVHLPTVVAPNKPSREPPAD